MWAPNTTGAQIAQTPPLIGAVRLVSNSNSEPCWWTVEVNAREVFRVVEGAWNPVNNIQINQGFPVSKLFAQISYHRTGGIGRRILVDIGPGFHLSVHSDSVDVDIVGPEGMSHIPPTTSVTSNGWLLDTKVVGAITCGCASLGKRGATFTQSVAVNAAQTVDVEIPAAATGVEIYAPGYAGASLVAGDFMPSNALVGVVASLGRIPFLTIAAQRTGIVPRPSGATHIRTTNDDAATRLYTYVFQLEF